MTEELAPPAETGQGDAPASQESWTATLPEDVRGYAENKGWKDPSDLLSSYKNLEKLRGVSEDKLIRLPDDPAAEGAMDPVYAKLGRPEAPDKYTNVLGDGFDSAIFGTVAEKAFQLGLGDEQFKGLQEIMAAESARMVEAQDTANIETFDAWKAKNPDGFANAGRVLSEVGLSEDQVSAMLSGDKTAIYDALARIGARTAESQVIQGDKPASEGFGMTPAAAKSKINELMADKSFTEKYYSSNQKIRQEAVNRMEKLHEIAASGGA